MDHLLRVEGISKSFRGLRAVDNVSLQVERGSIVSLIGPNGAGKTTCFNLLAGAFRPDAGLIEFDGGRIDGLRSDQICVRGIGRTFQIMKPFKELSTLENVTVGALLTTRDMRTARWKAEAVLEKLGMLGKRDQPAGQLTLPERKRLEVARALATEPKLLLLDEVMAGLRPSEVDQMVAVFRELNEGGTTIVLIEHVMRAVMALSHRVVVLHHGSVIASGEPAQIVRDPAVLECYLGEEVEV